jgi:hypothetical protein
VVPKLCDLMDSSQSYVQLCASVVFTVLLNTPGVPEAIAAAGYDQVMFKRLVDALRLVPPLPSPPILRFILIMCVSILWRI